MIDGQLQLEMSKPIYHAYIRDLVPVALTDSTLIVQSPSQEIAAWVQSRMTTTINRLLTGSVGKNMTLTVLVGVNVPEAQ